VVEYLTGSRRAATTDYAKKAGYTLIAQSLHCALYLSRGNERFSICGETRGAGMAVEQDKDDLLDVLYAMSTASVKRPSIAQAKLSYFLIGIGIASLTRRGR
jgi:hypothetical protein